MKGGREKGKEKGTKLGKLVAVNQILAVLC